MIYSLFEREFYHETASMLLSKLFSNTVFKKIVLLHDRESIGVVWNAKGLGARFGDDVLTPLKIISSGYWWLVLICGGIGVVFLLRRAKDCRELLAFPPVTVWMYFTLIHCVTVAGDRYHVPSSPYIAMIAAYTISVLIESKVTNPHRK